MKYESIELTPNMWPMLLDYSRDDCKRMLRKFELEAYASVVTALRAQGDLNKDKKKILQDLCSHLSISLERHRAEVRRAVNDERLNTIAYHISGPNTSTEWSIEGRRLIPLLPRLVPQTAFTGIANMAANTQISKNSSLPSPSSTGVKLVEPNIEDNYQSSASKRRRIDSQTQLSIQGQPTIVPIKSNSIHGQMVIQNPSNLSPNQRLMTQTGMSTTTKNIITTSPLNVNNSYTIGSTITSPPVAQSGTRVIFVSSTPTTTANIITTSKNLASYPLIRHTIAQQRPITHIPTSKSSTPRAGRPSTAINTSIVGLIGVSGSQKQMKSNPMMKSPSVTTQSNIAVAQTVSSLPFHLQQGTKVFTKTGGQQQVVVFPVNQKPLTVPLSQAAVKTISIPSSSALASNAQTFIYQQSAGCVKTVQKVQTPNLIIMQPKQIIQTAKAIPLASSAVTLSKATIKSQSRAQPFSAKKHLISYGKDSESGGLIDIKSNIGVEKQALNQISTITAGISESPKITAKRFQPMISNAYQEINVSDFSEGEVIEIDASSETITGLINSVKKGQMSSSDIMEFVKKAAVKEASVSKLILPYDDSKDDFQKDDKNDSSSSAETVSADERGPSPNILKSDIESMESPLCKDNLNLSLSDN